MGYTHRTGKWDVYYSPEVQQLTKEFMDCFLKDDASSGVLKRALCGWKSVESRCNHDIRARGMAARQDRYSNSTHHQPRKPLANSETSGSAEHSAKRGRSSFAFVSTATRS